MFLAAGNVAVAHVCALRQLLSGKDRGLQSCGGLPVYVTDETPPSNYPGIGVPFLVHLSFKPSHLIPYWIVFIFFVLVSLWTAVGSLLGFKSSDQTSLMSRRTVLGLASYVTVVSRMRAELCLDYSPKYSWEESQQRANSYYTKNLK